MDFLSFVLLLLVLLARTAVAESTITEADEKLFRSVHESDIDGLIAASKMDEFNVNKIIDPSGQTPLMRAVLQGSTPETVEMLLKLGADPLIGERDGYTPMHGAGFQGRAQLVPILIEKAHLDINERHSDGYTPITRACWGREQRHTETVKVMLIHGANPEEKMCSNVNGQDVCQSLVEVTSNLGTKAVLEKYFVSKAHGSSAEEREL